MYMYMYMHIYIYRDMCMYNNRWVRFSGPDEEAPCQAIARTPNAESPVSTHGSDSDRGPEDHINKGFYTLVSGPIQGGYQKLYVHICICICMYIICIYICIYIYMYICIYTYIYIYVHIFGSLMFVWCFGALSGASIRTERPGMIGGTVHKINLTPKGSKYHCSTYMDPKAGIWEPL